jgi:hypothetical protein
MSRFSALFLPGTGGSKWLYTDIDLEQAKAVECPLLCNGMSASKI